MTKNDQQSSVFVQHIGEKHKKQLYTTIEVQTFVEEREYLQDEL